MNSLSQGIFVFKNGLHGKPNKRKKSAKYSIAQTIFDSDENSRLWNDEYERTSNWIQSKINEIQTNNSDGHLAELCSFVAQDSVESKDGDSIDLPNMALLRVAAVLTGINKPDHHHYFKLLANSMCKKKIARTVFLPARDCPNIRTAMETLVSCMLSDGRKHNYRDEDGFENKDNNKVDAVEEGDESDDGEIGEDESGNGNNIESEDDDPPVKLRRNQYTLDVLQSWYDTKFANQPNDSKPRLAIIMPNFEEFKPTVVKDLIQILSNHCQRLPFVLILGVATSTTALLNTLSFTETTRINLRIFSGNPANQILDQIFDGILLTPICPFQLSRNVLEYLKDVFMFYDLTAKNFLRSIDYCLLDHYSNGNAYAVCSIQFQQAKRTIEKLKPNDFELIRRLPSFRTYVETLLKSGRADQAKLVIDIFERDEILRKQLFTLIQNIYIYFTKFYGQIRFLWTLVKDLPHAPMGKRLIDVYMHCQSAENGVAETEEFAKCWQLLSMTSKDEFIKLLKKCDDCLLEYAEIYCDTADTTICTEMKTAFDGTLKLLDDSIKFLEMDHRSSSEEANKIDPSPKTAMDNTMSKTNRTMFYQNLLQQNRAAVAKQSSRTRDILNTLRQHMEEEILPWKKAPPLFELFVYSDFDQIRSHLRGTSRSAIHKALTDPHAYLQCQCCAIENQFQLLPSMPDNSIAYGLLLECGQQVNLYDWMSTFDSIVGGHTADADDDDGAVHIPPEIQARFTRARAELHFMGYTKNSKRKTDHVTRTTW